MKTASRGALSLPSQALLQAERPGAQHPFPELQIKLLEHLCSFGQHALMVLGGPGEEWDISFEEIMCTL